MSEDEFVHRLDRGELFARARSLPALAEIAGSTGGGAPPPATVYLVGGAVRDLILGRELVDIDLALDGDPRELGAALGAPSSLETRFGTVSVERDGHRYDLARTRSERYPHPGALPEVEPAGIETDLARRDFTVNALALGLTGRHAGELLAAPHALEDLERGQLAVLQDRSFRDDPTRLLRLARYAARLGFTPAKRTRELAAEAVEDRALDTVSGTRIGNELRLLASEADPIAAFEAAASLGLPWAIDAKLARAALAVLPADGRPDLLVLGLALAGYSSEALDVMGFTAAERHAILEAREARALAQRLAGAGSSSAIARAVGTSGVETVALASSQGSPSQSETWLQQLRHIQLAINGDDLIESGIEQGPAIGHALAKARDALLDGEAPDREAQLRVALRAAE